MTKPATRQVWATRPAPAHAPSPTLMVPITIGDPINANAHGGTASVCRILTAPYLYMAAKVFNDDTLASRRTPDVHDKLAFIASHSEGLKRGYVRNGQFHRGRPHVSWPEALLYDVNRPDPKHLVGFAMPLFADSHPLSRLTSPKQRKVQFPDLPADGLVAAGLNIACAVADLHGANGHSGITIGDLTPRNVLITSSLRCQLIDSDSYQYQTSARTYGSRDTTVGFRSPRMAEAFRAGQPLPPFTIEDDAYCLAILLFHVLIDGAHPWVAGERFELAGVKPELEDNMLARRFPYTDHTKYHPPKIRLQTYQKLHPELRNAFEQTFLGKTPTSPEAWIKALATARSSLNPPSQATAVAA